ncbi:MAG: type II secretion system protein [Candidatus Marinimicrobia bacterium]|nr:type II secretion system protein [Candidatus Neomarinimicrobiota bacterium]
MMNKLLKHRNNRGFTLIEMAVVMTIFSLAGLGLVSSAVSIVGFYQDDMVSKDIKTYGNAVLNTVAEKIQGANKITVTTGPTGHDLVYLKYPGKGSVGLTKSIQVSQDGTFLWQGRDMLPQIPLQLEGMYRNKDQREIFLAEFTVHNLIQAEYEPVQHRNEIKAVGKSVYEVSIIYGLTTNFKQGSPQTEYLTFKKKVYSFQNLIHRMGG